MKPLTSSSAAETQSTATADLHDRSRQLIGEAIIAKGVAHGLGLVGSLGMKATKPDRLRKALRSQAGRKLVHGVVLDAATNALAIANITYGVEQAEIEAAVDEFLEAVADESGHAVARKVAKGVPPERGQDGRVEYPLNYRGLPFSQLHDSRAGSPSVNVHFVHADETIAVLRPQVAAKPGTSVSGDAIKPPGEAPIEPSFDKAAGPNTQIDGQQLRAACDGLYQEDDNGWIKIVPLIELDHVDLNTVRIPETGITEAAVTIKSDVIGGLRISTGEDLFVGGNVEDSAPLQARNLVVRGKLSASPDHRSSPIEAEEIALLGELTNRTVPASRILVRGDSHYMVLGVRLDGEARAYPFDNMGRQAVINDDLGGVDIVVVWDRDSNIALPFARAVDGQSLTFDLEEHGAWPLGLRDRETGTLWNVEGVALEGPLRGQRLTQVPAHNSFWFAWVTFWQNTDVWQG